MGQRRPVEAEEIRIQSSACPSLTASQRQSHRPQVQPRRSRNAGKTDATIHTLSLRINSSIGVKAFVPEVHHRFAVATEVVAKVRPFERGARHVAEGRPALAA